MRRINVKSPDARLFKYVSLKENDLLNRNESIWMLYVDVCIRMSTAWLLDEQVLLYVW